MNICMFTGNLTRDVEIKTVGTTKVASFGLAVSRKFKKGDGTDKVETNFFDMEVWDKAAETIAKFFKKGSPITVQCSAKQETWDDKAGGGKRSKIKFRVDQFYFPPKPPKSRESGGSDDGSSHDNHGGDNDEPTPF